MNDNLRGVNLEGERHLILDNSGTSNAVNGRYKGKRVNTKIHDIYRRAVTVVKMSYFA